MTTMGDGESVPEVPNSGVDGTQTAALHGEIVRPVTRSAVPNGEFDEAIGKIIETRQRGISNDVTALLFGKLRDQTTELSEQKELNKCLSRKLSEVHKLHAETRSALTVEKHKRESDTTQNKLIAAILVLAGITSSFAFKLSSEELSDAGWIMLYFSGALYFLGIFGKQIFGKKEDK